MPKAQYTKETRELVIREWSVSTMLLREMAAKHSIPLGTIASWIYEARLRGDSRVPMLSDAELGERRHRSRRAR